LDFEEASPKAEFPIDGIVLVEVPNNSTPETEDHGQQRQPAPTSSIPESCLTLGQYPVSNPWGCRCYN